VAVGAMYRGLSPAAARAAPLLWRHACVRSFASEVKEGAKDESALAKEELKKEHIDANASAKKQGSKVKKHAFFVSWYVLMGAGGLRWYQKKLKEKNEGSVEMAAEASFRRRITSANASLSKN